MAKVNFPEKNHIEIRDGQARIAGRNVKVKMVISRLIHDPNATIETVMEQYELSRADVLACLAYYYDYESEINHVFEIEDVELAKTAVPSSKWKAQMYDRLKAMGKTLDFQE